MFNHHCEDHIFSPVYFTLNFSQNIILTPLNCAGACLRPVGEQSSLKWLVTLSGGGFWKRESGSCYVLKLNWGITKLHYPTSTKRRTHGSVDIFCPLHCVCTRGCERWRLKRPTLRAVKYLPTHTGARNRTSFHLNNKRLHPAFNKPPIPKSIWIKVFDYQFPSNPRPRPSVASADIRSACEAASGKEFRHTSSFLQLTHASPSHQN